MIMVMTVGKICDCWLIAKVMVSRGLGSRSFGETKNGLIFSGATDEAGRAEDGEIGYGNAKSSEEMIVQHLWAGSDVAWNSS